MTITDVLDSLPKVDFDNPIKKQMDAVLSDLEIPTIHRPDFEIPRYPDNITALTDDALGYMLGVYKVWTGYFESWMALKEADILLVESSVSRYVKNEVSAKNRQKSHVERDEIIVALDGTLTQLRIQYKVIEARQKFYESCASALSRELTRRTSKNFNA